MTRTAYETFMSDQVSAAARDLASRGTPTVVIEPYSGEPCTWCGCDLLADMLTDDCDNRCTESAELVMSIHHVDGKRDEFPLCHGHKPDAIRFVTALMGAGGFR